MASSTSFDKSAIDKIECGSTNCKALLSKSPDGYHLITSTSSSSSTQKSGSVVSDNLAEYCRLVMKSTLEMLERRGGYKVRGLLDTISSGDSKWFQEAILSPTYFNPLRDVIARSYSKRIVPQFRIMMSTLVQNPDDNYTAIFFAVRNSSQVSKKLMTLFCCALLELRREGKIRVTEVIIITPTLLSHDSEAARMSIEPGYFTQVFRDEDVIAPPTDCAYVPDIRIFNDKETKEFFEQEQALTHHKLQIIFHQDPLFKYLGARPRRIVEIRRPSLVPESLRREELTYAYIQ